MEMRLKEIGDVERISTENDILLEKELNGNLNTDQM